MALVIGALQPPLQVVDPRREHRHHHGAAERDEHVHNRSIARAMAA